MSIIEQFKTNPIKTNSITLKLVIVGFLLFIFLPILAQVEGLVEEREQRQHDTVSEVSEKWGGRQTITAPVLVVPYSHPSQQVKYAYFLPEELSIDGTISSSVKSRDIYDVPLYESDFTFKGYFNQPDFNRLNTGATSVNWAQAKIHIGIPDMRGVTTRTSLTWRGQESAFSAGERDRFFENGLSTPVVIDTVNPQRYDYSFNLKLRGSQELYLMPTGNVTTANITSNWPSPSFNGGFLPTNHEITDKGFTANWSVLDLNRSFPQQWSTDSELRFDTLVDGFGVELFLPVDIYQQSMRSVKYGIGVILLVFMTFFLVEVITKRRIHPLQYLLIGLALTIFYTLLLSLSEYINFLYAYVIASIAIITMVTLFSNNVMKNYKLGLATGGTLTLLYVFIYTLLQSQNYTLLMGSIALFVILAVVMFLLRKVDFYKAEV